MMYKRYARIAGLMALLILLLNAMSGCSRPEQAPSQEETVPEAEEEESREAEPAREESAAKTPAKGGKLIVSTVIQKSYNPLTTDDFYLAQILSLVFSPLVDIDEQGYPHPSVASEWEIAEDNKSVTLTVNPDAVWHDESEVDAGDIAYSVQTLMESETSVYKDCAANIAGTEVLDKEHIRILFKESSPLNLNQLVFPILPADFYAESGHEEEMLGCGPYMLDSYVTMEKFILKANPDFFGPKPYIETVEILLTRSDARMDSFNQGVTNLAYTQDEIPWSAYINKSSVSLHTFSGTEAEVLTFNLEKIPDADTRKAIAYALDAQEILRTTSVDKGDVTENLISPVRWYGPANPSHYGQNVEKTAELLDFSQELSWELMINKRNDLQRRIAEEMAAELKDAGIEMTLKELEPSAYREALSGHNYEMALEEITCDSDLDMKKCLSGGNHAGYTSSAMEEKLKELGTQAEETAVHQGFAGIGTQLADDLPYYVLFFRKRATLTGYGVMGSLEPTERQVFRGVWNLYMETE